MTATCLYIRLLKVVLDEDRWLILIFLQVLLCQRDVRKHKHLEEDLKITLDELFIVREGRAFANVADNGEDQPFALAVC